MNLDPNRLELDSDISTTEFFNALLAAALREEDLRISGWIDRGGCVLRFKFEVTSVDLATCFHSNPELRH